MGNRLFVNYDSKSPARKGISVRFRAPVIGVWQISYTAGEKVNAYNGAGKDGPAPFYLKWSFPRYRFKMLSSTCLMNSSWGHDDSSWATPNLTITTSRDGMTATT